MESRTTDGGRRKHGLLAREQHHAKERRHDEHADGEQRQDAAKFPGDVFESRHRLGENRVDGAVVDILETGAYDVFVVRPEDGSTDMLLPSIPDVVVDLRPTDGVRVVRPMTYWGE